MANRLIRQVVRDKSVVLIRRAKARSIQSAAASEGERGASLTEYALIVSLVVIASMAAVAGLTSRSGDYLEATGDDIGEARVENEFIPDELPDEPEWDLPSNFGNGEDGGNNEDDPGTTSTTAAGATTTTAAGATTTTTPPPAFSVAIFGSAGLCFQVDNNGAGEPPLIAQTCNGTPEQLVQGFGAAGGPLEITFEASAGANQCWTNRGGATSQIVMAGCDGSAQQQWTVTNAIEIRNVADSTLCADDRSGFLTLEQCDGSATQRFG